MIKTMFAQLLIFLTAIATCFGNSQAADVLPLYDLETNQYFMLDSANSTDDTLRLCVPVAYPNWFSVPTSSVEQMKSVEEKVIDGETVSFVQIQFKPEDSALNSLLSSYQNLIIKENHIDGTSTNKRWGWRPPWTWSTCAKCKLGVNAFITISVIGAAAAAGTTGPGAYAVWEALIIEEYGLAAWEAIKAGIFSLGVGEICEKICQAQGEC